MAILNASELGQSFGAFDLFANITVTIPKDGKIGMVGPNGVGKTTLLLILAGLSKPSAGAVHWARGTRLGYLPQEAAQAFFGQDHTLFDEMLSVFAALRVQEKRLRQMEKEMETAGAPEDLLEKYGAALERFELAGGYDYETRTKQVLQGLGFGEAEWQLQLSHLSGGQKTRALLARLLLEKPDLLILDEPTNHLDVEAIEWLENTLRVWDGAMLMVSHDRYFLNKVANAIWEMSPAGIELYRGNYDAYVRQRQERWELRHKEFDAFKQRIEKELDYVRRNIAGQRTQQAQGKLSRISRELYAVQKGGLQAIRGKSWATVSDEMVLSRHSMNLAEATAAHKNLSRPDGMQPTFDVRLKAGRRSGKNILRTKNLTVGYPGNPLFSADNFEFHRLECAALIGPNGSGKTTFLRVIQGELEPLSGEVRLGASLNIGYFDQAHERLDPSNSVLDELMRHHNMFISEARSYLGSYRFRGDDVFQPVSTLSGGERSRLALAILALDGANFLLLDEPTNHLDIPAQEMLQTVLEKFKGTILLVTHDRYLVDRLATQLWILEDGQLRIFKGTYQEYLAESERRQEEVKQVASAGHESRRRQRAVDEKVSSAKKRAERQAELESEIDRHEVVLEQLGRELQAAGEDGAFDKLESLGIEYAAVEARLQELLGEWENLAGEQTLAG